MICPENVIAASAVDILANAAFKNNGNGVELPSICADAAKAADNDAPGVAITEEGVIAVDASILAAVPDNVVPEAAAEPSATTPAELVKVDAMAVLVVSTKVDTTPSIMILPCGKVNNCNPAYLSAVVIAIGTFAKVNFDDIL